MQEAAWKDVEQAFGVLQAQFAILANPARFWYTNDLASVMQACIILHNMIVEDERDTDDPIDFDGTDTVVGQGHTTQVPFESFLERFKSIRDSNVHYQLRNDLIAHLWNLKGDEDETE